MLVTLEQTRLRVSKKTAAQRKSKLGQFFTPVRIAKFMVSLFPNTEDRCCHLLDPGAGIGSLSAAFLERWISGGFCFDNVTLDTFEIDDNLLPYLEQTFEKYQINHNLSLNIRKDDFIQVASEWLSGSFFSTPLPKYTHVILNPPYKKILSHSAHRLALRHVGIETVNLYSAFVALSVALTKPGGHIVAIIPRSFCNGPYYRPFRDFLFEHAAICHIHLFESRNMAFKDDAVLQENIIMRLERNRQQGRVTISTSTDDTFSDLDSHEYPFDQIVNPNDGERFIHIPTCPEQIYDLSPNFNYLLEELGLMVSTGPVVAFRLKDYLRDTPEEGTVPMLYPCHFSGHDTAWPGLDKKKPNAIVLNEDTRKWLYPNGFYCVVRRFSSKEEKRRVVASVVNPETFDNVSLLGFENHLNVFHINKMGLSKELAHGLAVYLNSTIVDNTFRRFSGHTQVNVTDLKIMKYPNHDVLNEFGRWSMRQKQLTQVMIDSKIGNLIYEK